MIRLWLVLNVADLIVTLVALERGCSEVNPMMSGLGAIELVAYKLGLTLLVVALLVRIRRLYLLRWLNVGIALVVVWNAVWILA